MRRSGIRDPSYSAPGARLVVAKQRPSKRLSLPDPLKKRTANEFERPFPTRTSLRQRGLALPASGVASVGRTGSAQTRVIKRAAEAAKTVRHGGEGLRTLDPRKQAPRPSNQSVTGRGAAKLVRAAEHAEHSDKRENKAPTCKPRPEAEPLKKHRGAGSPKRDFVPWCEARTRR